ncbi:MAG: DUF3592 domain-containing protein [Candidatus Omnitrophica bacterium]|nr:DUF3592 domain-containing protein [Candidatus Omnitrophota bacterium]
MQIRTRQRTTAEPRALVLFFAIFLLFGLGFSLLIVGQFFRDIRPYFWPRAGAIILSSGIAESNPANGALRFSPDILFQYRYQGTTYQSNRPANLEISSHDYTAIRVFCLRYPAGATVDCFVNPENPAQAVLERRFPWIVFVLVLPVIFIVIGGGGI